MRQDNTETSVMVSLNELVSLEEERVQEEKVARRRVRDEEVRVRGVLLAQQRAEEERRKAAEAQAHADVARRALEEKVRLEGLRQAEVERARVAAQAAAQLELVDAQHRHEREMLKLDTERKKGRTRVAAIIGMMGVAIAGSAAAIGVFAGSDRPSETDIRLEQLTQEQQRLLRDRVASLDNFHDKLRTGSEELASIPPALAAGRDAVTQARAAIGSDAIDVAQVNAYDKALTDYADELGKSHRLERLTGLDTLHGKLRAKLDKVSRAPKELAQAGDAAESARRSVDAADPDTRALETYDGALEKLALAIADLPKQGQGGFTKKDDDKTEPKIIWDKHDPLNPNLPGE